MTAAPAAKPLIRFRVHFTDGRKVDVMATDPTDARAKAVAQHQGKIDKVKLDREA